MVQKSLEQTLVVLGAGPKALAIAAKRNVLAALGWKLPRVFIVEAKNVAAHWSGKNGYTDGNQALGTPPQKDVGFPYSSSCWGGANAEVDCRMLAFSWTTFQVACRRFAGWIDRHQPAPTHAEWGRYLEWVAQIVAPVIPISGLPSKQTGIIQASVQQIDIRKSRWSLACTFNNLKFRIGSDGLVVTGPGPPRTFPGQSKNPPMSSQGIPRLTDGRSFWTYLGRFRSLPPPSIGIVGAGETAASVAVALVQIFGPSCNIEVINPSGMAYSRGESFVENRLFTDPRGWTARSKADRLEFVERTDRGVFSLQAKSILDRAENVETVAGRVERIDASKTKVAVTTSYDGKVSTSSYDYLIVAAGFDPLWFVSILSSTVQDRLKLAVGSTTKEAIQEKISPDLSITGLVPRLHLPMLAGFAQGPGFPNLSSLGLLSDRVLATYSTGVPTGAMATQVSREA